MRKTAMTLSGMVAVTALFLSGCAAAGDPAPEETESVLFTQAEIDEALNTPTTITYWSWASFIVPAVAQFQLKYPNITVELVNVGVGDDQYTKINAALDAGSGAPDLAMIDYNRLPEFVVKDALADLTPFGGAALEEDYTAATWGNLTTPDGKVIGLPQNANPMVYFYRSDLFAEAGISGAPETWDDFLAAADDLKAATGANITTINPGDMGLTLGLMQQNDAAPFSYDGVETVSIDLTNETTEQVADLLTDMIASGNVGLEPDRTPDWYQGLANNATGGWLLAAAGQNNLINTMTDQVGKWSIGATPQFVAGATANGSIGGSATAVLESSDNKIAAYALAEFLFNNTPIVAQGANRAFPALKEVLTSDAFIQNQSEYFGGQQANKFYAEQWDAVLPAGSLPFMSYANAQFATFVGKAMTDGTDIYRAFELWEADLLEYAVDQGFTVEEVEEESN